MYILPVTEEVIILKRGPTAAIVLNNTNMELCYKHYFLCPLKNQYLTAHLKQKDFIFFRLNVLKYTSQKQKIVKNNLIIDFLAPMATSKLQSSQPRLRDYSRRRSRIVRSIRKG